MTVLGIGQANFLVGNPTWNAQVIQQLLDNAANQGVELLVLPELANSGYVFHSVEEARACAVTAPDGTVCKMLRQWSEAGRLVACGICEAEGDNLFNSAVVFTEGRHIGTYRKAHLFLNEKDIFKPGSAEPPVFDFHGARVGLFICYDWAFPEMARVLALQGAQIILHPANLVLPYGQQAMAVRSIENRVYTATANRFGMERGVNFSGMSQITSPTGELLAQAGPEFEGIVTVDVDLAQADNKWMTARNHLLDDRRPDLYRRLSE